MAEVYGYEEMLLACGDCKDIIATMNTAVENFDSATGVYASNIKDNIADAANALVEQLRDIIERTKKVIDDMNDLMGESAGGLIDTEDGGVGEIDNI